MAINSKQIFTLAFSAIVLSIFIVSAVFISGCVGSTNQNQSNLASEIPINTGTAVFTITDAAMNMGAVSSVNITINKIEINSKNKGWIVLSNEVQTYDLLELKAENTSKLLVIANLSDGLYNQVRLHISKVIIIKNGAPIEAKLPSNVLKMNINFKVIENKTSTVSFDFIADESLHTTGDGKIIMAPVIKVETRTSVNVQIKGQNKVEIQDGKVEENFEVGMNEKGDVDVGIKIKANTEISISENGKIEVFRKGKVNNIGTQLSIKNITLNKQKYTANEKINIEVYLKLNKNADIQVHIYGIASRQGSNLIDETKNVSVSTEGQSSVKFDVNAPTCTHGCGARYFPGLYLLNAEVIVNGEVVDKTTINVELY
ncbi:MAG: hypothetical protein COW47_01190 [Candidatus Huberarchaeum crystalense]|uniref:DUF4382 domain-containing protein n=1 Tax=Huberarchaeum crystalense TaxID=2014257 RepID=A0A2G9LKB6_HUBC1|nr:DUF4382 domain-containing protein [archaeon]OIP20847.1 MAG: hypothetical protein AUJ91_00165 [archaeon CG2_30_31_98]PIN66620.1 MAG: hypothetical protein COW69_01310 [Candidatus Huberarchaeum crystalense]NCS98222.1 DUF4382 domain-containing protein [archaeon]PIV13552.1 MAG: hypothetical protein COS45_02260 [Candidatus Huberarchaeum crystalense]